jgi:membrane protease YdiL (CAAX protease family)
VTRASLPAAVGAVLLALLATAGARGLPGLDGLLVRLGVRLEGLGVVVDRALPDGGRVVHERPRRELDGTEVLVSHQATLGPELVSLVLQAALLGGVVLWLRRPGPEPRAHLLPDREELGRAVAALTFVVPLVLLAAVLVARAAADAGGECPGAPLRWAVQGMVFPVLSHPFGAVVFALRFVVVGPLLEEALWRGVVYPGLRRRLSFAAASALSAFLFGAWHAATGWTERPALALQYLFALGACALVEARPGRLGAGLVLHVVGNASALLLFVVCLRAPERLLALFGLPDRPL